MAFWIILILVLLFCYFYAGMCVYIVGKPGRNTEFGERLVMFGLSLFFWPFIPILALIAHD